MVQNVFQIMSLRAKCSTASITYFSMCFICQPKKITFVWMLMIKCNKLFHFRSQTIFIIRKYKSSSNLNCSAKKLLSNLQLKKWTQFLSICIQSIFDRREIYKGLAAEWGWNMKLLWIPVVGKNQKTKTQSFFLLSIWKSLYFFKLFLNYVKVKEDKFCNHP